MTQQTPEQRLRDALECVRREPEGTYREFSIAWIDYERSRFEAAMAYAAWLKDWNRRNSHYQAGRSMDTTLIHEARELEALVDAKLRGKP